MQILLLIVPAFPDLSVQPKSYKHNNRCLHRSRLVNYALKFYVVDAFDLYIFSILLGGLFWLPLFADICWGSLKLFCT